MSFELLNPGVVTAFATLVALAAAVGIALVLGGVVGTAAPPPPRPPGPPRVRPDLLPRTRRTRTEPFLGRSRRAPRLRLPAALGRPRPARPRQQRDVRRLPPGGAGRHAAHARRPTARAVDLAEGVVVVRHDVRYVAPLVFRLEPVKIECWVTEIRAASFTMAYEIFDERRRHAARLPAGQDPADAVRLRRGAAPPDHRRREGRAGALPRADEPRPTCGAMSPAPRRPRHYPCTSGSPTSTSTGTSTT